MAALYSLTTLGVVQLHCWPSLVQWYLGPVPRVSWQFIHCDGSESLQNDTCEKLIFAMQTDWLRNWCRPSPAQWFLGPSPTELMAMFYSLTGLEAFNGSDIAMQNECGMNAKLLLALSSKIIVCPKSHGTHDCISQSNSSGNLHTTLLQCTVRVRINLRQSVAKLNCFWSSPAHSFLASASSRSTTKICVPS
jgi:hypothetical protein